LDNAQIETLRPTNSPEILSTKTKRVLVSGPKGGIGKTTLSRNIGVAAALHGLRVATLDLDPQRSLTLWYGKRPDEMAEIAHFQAGMVPKDIREALVGINGYDLLVIDTPPSIEDHPEVFKMLIVVTDLAIIPTGQSSDDVDIVLPWMAFMRRFGVNAWYVLNRVKPRTRGFTEAQTKLLKAGRICAVELPDYEDVQFSASRGLGLLELRNAKGGEHISGIWSFVAQELGF
jgi:chromosome partitioning protein